MKTRWSESESEAEEAANRKLHVGPELNIGHWFILPLLLATLTMQFSLDRKRWSDKQNP